MEKPKKTLIFIKMESLFDSFIEDSFLGYILYYYNFLTCFYYLTIFITNLNKFHKLIGDELLNSNLFNHLHFNNKVIDYVRSFDPRHHEIILVGSYNEDLLKILKNYFHFDKIIGNKDNENFNFYQLINKSFSNKIIKKSILITDNLDWFISYKFYKVVVTGQLMKIFANCGFHYYLNIPIEFIKTSNTYNGFLYKKLKQLLNKEISKYHWILLGFLVPLVEMSIILRMFFLNIFYSMFFIVFIKSIFFSKDYFFKFNFLAIIETNNFINIYNIINNFRPMYSSPQIEKYFLKNGVFKSFGSLRIGLFLFCFVSFLYLQNRFLLFLQIFYISFLLKYAFEPFAIFLKNQTFFYIFNALLYSLFV